MLTLRANGSSGNWLWANDEPPRLGTGGGLEFAEFRDGYSFGNRINGFAFGSDGRFAYVLVDRDVHRYILATPWSLQGMALLESVALPGLVAYPTGISASPDGVYIYDNDGDEIHEFRTRPNSTFNPTIEHRIEDISGQTTAAKGLSFRADGRSMFFVDRSNPKVIEYDGSTPWRAWSMRYNKQMTISGLTNAEGVAFGNDGREMYIIGWSSGGQLIKYSLSNPWDISTATEMWRHDTHAIYGIATPWHITANSDGSRIVGFDDPARSFFEFICTPQTRDVIELRQIPDTQILARVIERIAA